MGEAGHEARPSSAVHRLSGHVSTGCKYCRRRNRNNACVAGAGLAILSTWHVNEDIDAGRLMPITLEDAEPKELGIWAVYPTRRQILPKVRVFVDATWERLA